MEVEPLQVESQRRNIFSSNQRSSNDSGQNINQRNSKDKVMMPEMKKP